MNRTPFDFSAAAAGLPSFRTAAQALPARRENAARPRRLLASGLALALGLVALPASAAVWWTPTPSVAVGSTSVNVRNAGARGDGVHDDTAAFQAAINSLPSTGGTVTVPAGRYMINALSSIRMRSHTRLKLDPSAQLVAIPNNQGRSYVVRVWGVSDVEVTGGQIIGERVKHIGTSGEWGMGVDVRSSKNVYLHDFKVSDCWGDGVYVGANGSAGNAVPSTYVTINHIVSNNNRRQGLSLTVVDKVFVYNSIFSNTHGTAPQAGIDIEPMSQGASSNVRIEKSTMIGNMGNGLVVSTPDTGLVVKSSTLKQNHGFGVLIMGASKGWIAANLITENGLDGVGLLKGTHDMKVTSNTITYNSTRWFYANNKSIYTLTNSARDVQIDSSTYNIFQASNTLSPRP
ncbi:MAG TPA: right-handed parallel beta-helix repeat-containing protein [Dyella sp.]|nr:right-handed parallel beta-helix repeat-containing protein [Dyella sp.]